MKVRFFDPGRAYLKIKPQIDRAMQRVLKDGDLILRKDVEEFEKNLAYFVGTKYAVAVASGTDALILSLKAAGIAPGDKVLCPSYTFRATVEAVHHVGAIPVLVDFDEPFDDLLKGVRAFIPAHIAGQMLIDKEVYGHMKKRGIIVIEDACQAIGAEPVRGLTACYSFYPAKILGCYGDGGAVATNDKKIADEIRLLRNHYKGDWGKYAYNSRLDNLQAAVLNVKIKLLPRALLRRLAIARMYDEGLMNVVKPWPRDVYQDYIIYHGKIKSLKKHLTKHGVETMDNGYPFPAALTKGPNVVEYEEHSLRLPIYPELTNKEVRHVIKAVNSWKQ